ncbi:MAG: alpha/beta hydrolase [Ktedonobacteraceae bacterium]
MSRLWNWILEGITLLGVLVMGSLSLFAVILIHAISRPYNHGDPDIFVPQLPTAGALPPHFSQRPLEFQTVDGVVLRGDFLAQPHPAPTIIVCHGYHISRDYLRSTTAYVYSMFGCNLLLFDFRGHGQSDRAAISLGNGEVRDLQAAITVASQQPETLPGTVILHGFSMGAAVALLMPPRPEVAAIIADSPYARLDDILRRFVVCRLTEKNTWWSPLFQRLHVMMPAVSWAIVEIGACVFRVRFGYPLIARPDRCLERWRALPNAHPPYTSPPILLIHGEQDSVIPIAEARSLEAQARALTFEVETYYVKGAQHCGAYERDPQRYIQEVQHSLIRHLDPDVFRYPAA